MNKWDAVLFGLAAYVATCALVRLMVLRRAELIGQFRGVLEKDRSKASESDDSGPPSRGGRQATKDRRAA